MASSNATEGTIELIGVRARCFRRFAWGCLVLLVLLLISALSGHMLLSLTGLGLLVPVVGCFILADGWLTQRWRRAVLERWSARALSLHTLRETLGAIHTLPEGTLAAMLATLPVPPTPTAEDRMVGATRGAIARVMRVLDRCRLTAAALLVAGQAAAALMVVACAALRSCEPLWVGLSFLLLPPLGALARRADVARARRDLVALARHADFDGDVYRATLVLLDWRPLSAAQRDDLVHPLARDLIAKNRRART
ncbi:hypothetical protein LJR290_005919 [Variovorax sp. LjRoot290]|uniref:hypothetical protein n=1 Tax=Variovorax sp. LjRoot290 TaxID=3342316 RepID=UPI003ED0C3D5